MNGVMDFAWNKGFLGALSHRKEPNTVYSVLLALRIITALCWQLWKAR